MDSTAQLKIFICLIVVVVGCQGHGRVIEPPSRASAWRFGFNTPPDYNDNEGFCGGFSHQYQTQDGKCGICGDPWDQVPRAHEVGGVYATGTIVRHYQEGQVLNLTADITSNHLGHFEARICPDPEFEATQECLDMHRLNLADGSGNKLNITNALGHHTMLLQLPKGLTCNHCVIQWRYVTGNNWGLCPDGTGALGCGPQEEFRACSDVTISSSKPQQRKLIHPVTATSKTESIHNVPSSPTTLKTSLTKKLNCKGAGVWSNLPGASKWCTLNCNHNPTFCPATHCLCN